MMRFSAIGMLVGVRARPRRGCGRPRAAHDEDLGLRLRVRFLVGRGARESRSAWTGRSSFRDDARRVDGVSEASLFVVGDRQGRERLSRDGRLRPDPAGRAGPARPRCLATLKEKEVTALARRPRRRRSTPGGSPGGNVYRIDKGDRRASITRPRRGTSGRSPFSGNEPLRRRRAFPGRSTACTSAGEARASGSTRLRTRTCARSASIRAGRIWAGTSGSGLVLRIDPVGRRVDRVRLFEGRDHVDRRGPRRARLGRGRLRGRLSGFGAEPISAPREAPPTRRAAKPARGRRGRAGEDRRSPCRSPRGAPRAFDGTAQGGYSSEVLLFEEGEPPRLRLDEPAGARLRPRAGRRTARVLAATGPNGKLYRDRASAGASLERTFDEKQVIDARRRRRRDELRDGSLPPGGRPRQGEYVSAVKDTGRTSRFGAFRWEGEVPSGTKRRVRVPFG